MDDFLEPTQSAAKGDVLVPVGHIVCSSKWRNTDLTSNIQSSVQILYQENLGVINFYPSNHTGVVYVNEADLVTATGYRRKLAKLRKANKLHVLVLVERTPTSSQYFSAAQKFCVLELGFSLIPVPSQKHAGSILANMVHVEGHSGNPFLKKRKMASLDQAMLTTVQAIPKLGAVKARALLEKFGSIHAISTADIEDLASVVGKASAQHIRNFLGNG